MSARRADAGASRALARLLTAGIGVGCVLVAAGAVLAAFDGGLYRNMGLGDGGAGFGALLALDGAAFIHVGILVLILTPIVRVIAVAALLLQRKDRGGVVYAAVVLLLLTLATALDLRH